MMTPTKTPGSWRGNMLFQPSIYNPFDKFFRNDFLGFWYGNIPETLPSVNIKNESDHYRIDMAAPGLRKEDFNIDAEAGVVIISCERSPEEKETDFSRREYNFSNFSRRVSLPENADTERVTAKYINGILSVHVAKKNGSATGKNQKIKIE
jgi:HSP20 family protein